jgi:hypothetical protein
MSAMILSGLEAGNLLPDILRSDIDCFVVRLDSDGDVSLGCGEAAFCSFQLRAGKEVSRVSTLSMHIREQLLGMLSKELEYQQTDARIRVGTQSVLDEPIEDVTTSHDESSKFFTLQL